MGDFAKYRRPLFSLSVGKSLIWACLVSWCTPAFEGCMWVEDKAYNNIDPCLILSRHFVSKQRREASALLVNEMKQVLRLCRGNWSIRQTRHLFSPKRRWPGARISAEDLQSLSSPNEISSLIKTVRAAVHWRCDIALWSAHVIQW